MIEYNAKDLVRRARQLADLENSEFISWNEEISLLNESYIKLYQKLINSGDKSFIKTVQIGNGENSLPSDFWQLRSLMASNGVNTYPLHKKADTERYPTACYEIKGRSIFVHGVSCEVTMQYYPLPMTLSVSPSEVALDFSPAESELLTAYDKTYCLYSEGTYSVLNIQNGKTIYSGSVPENTTKVKAFMNSRYLLLFVEITTETEEEESETTYQYSLIDLIKGTSEDYEASETRRFVALGEVLYLLDGSNLVSVQTGDIVKTGVSCPNSEYLSAIDYADGELSDWWTITDNGGLIHNGNTFSSFFVSNIKNGFLVKGEFYLVSEAGAFVVYADEIERLDNGAKVCEVFNKVDFSTGYGFTAHDMNGYYIESFLKDTELDFPNNFYYQILAYYLAIAMKSKQGGDTSALVIMLEQQEQTFFDTLTNDDYGSVRIGNVY